MKQSYGEDMEDFHLPGDWPPTNSDGKHSRSAAKRNRQRASQAKSTCTRTEVATDETSPAARASTEDRSGSRDTKDNMSHGTPKSRTSASAMSSSTKTRTTSKSNPEVDHSLNLDGMPPAIEDLANMSEESDNPDNLFVRDTSSKNDIETVESESESLGWGDASSPEHIREEDPGQTLSSAVTALQDGVASQHRDSVSTIEEAWQDLATGPRHIEDHSAPLIEDQDETIRRLRAEIDGLKEDLNTHKEMVVDLLEKNGKDDEAIIHPVEERNGRQAGEIDVHEMENIVLKKEINMLKKEVTRLKGRDPDNQDAGRKRPRIDKNTGNGRR